jgi:phage terminase Nu1 subunit (DNA packaging protein)
VDRSEAERRFALAKAQKEEMLVAERQGLVVEFETVRQYVAGMIVDARNQLLRLPSELCDRLGAMGAGECRQLLDQEIRQALGKLKEFGG